MKKPAKPLNGVLGGLQRTVATLSSQTARQHRDLLAVMCSLWLHADRRGLCWPGRKTIAHEAGLTPKRVTWALRRLCELAVIRLEEQSVQEKQAKSGKNKYRVCALYRVISDGKGRDRVTLGGRDRVTHEQVPIATCHEPPAESTDGNTDAGGQAALVSSPPATTAEPIASGEVVSSPESERLLEGISGATAAMYNANTKGLPPREAREAQERAVSEYVRAFCATEEAGT